MKTKEKTAAEQTEQKKKLELFIKKYSNTKNYKEPEKWEF